MNRILFTLSILLVASNALSYEYIVQYASGVEVLKGLHSQQALKTTQLKDLYLVKSKTEILNKLKSYRGITRVEKNIRYTTLAKKPKTSFTDKLFTSQWALKNNDSVFEGNYKIDLNALEAWKITKGSRDIKIAVLDTGIEYTHEDLKNQILINYEELNGTIGVDDDKNGYVDDVYGYDFVNNKPNGMDDHGHGTHCAGIIGAEQNNRVGISGIMPEVSLLPVKFLDQNGGGDLAKALEAIDYAISMNVDIMSNSWGSEEESEFLKEYVEKAKEHGILFVAAAGNYGIDIDDTPIYPAIYSRELENVITVAAHGQDGYLAEFSDFGKNSVQIAAPGVDIVSTWINNTYESFSGTSMATPYIAGVLGLLKSIHPEYNFHDIRKKLRQTSIPSRKYKNIKYAGRINAYTLLSDIQPVRPHEKKWKTFKLKGPFESQHPYANGQFISKKITIPGAKFIRAIIKEHDFEDGFDFLKIRVPSTYIHRDVVEEITGRGRNHRTNYLDGDTIDILFTSKFVNSSNWGFKIEELEYIE